jgi:TRAP-type C4-dicarboxylate transport system permease small subunit
MSHVRPKLKVGRYVVIGIFIVSPILAYYLSGLLVWLSHNSAHSASLRNYAVFLAYYSAFAGFITVPVGFVIMAIVGIISSINSANKNDDA